jgi:hypothetical protein
MPKYQELHDNDGVILWYCFLTHFSGTITENLIETCYQLSDIKFHLSNFQNNILSLTNAIHISTRRLLEGNEIPSI